MKKGKESDSQLQKGQLDTGLGAQPFECVTKKIAKIWCTPLTKDIEFRRELAEEFYGIVHEYMEALIWCSGSADFGPGGIAEVGWKKICEPLLRT